MKLKILISSLLILASFQVLAQPRSFRCPQPLPEFTLGEKSNPSKTQVQQLCACIWNKLPDGGWEREAAILISQGKDPGFLKRNGFISRFGEALEVCGGYKL